VASVVEFQVVCEPGLVAAVGRAADHQAGLAGEWWQGARRVILGASVTAAARRAALAELRKERDRRRLAGQHFDTRSAVVAYFVKLEMDGRGWREKWPPIPHGEGRLPGRRWGSANAVEGRLVGRLDVYLPGELAERLRRATWRASAPATRRLQDPDLDWAERDRLRARVVTTADVIRAAAEAAVAALPVPDPEPVIEA